MMVSRSSHGRSIGAAGGWLKEGGTVRCRLLLVLVWLSLLCLLLAFTGSGVDNVIEITVVTSCGEYLTTNNYRNSDLFWALRGGGGGTYSVVTYVTYRTYESLPVTYVTWLAI